MDQKITKWQKHIGELVDEVLDINERKLVFERQREIAKSNPRLQDSNIFVSYLFRNYAEAQVLAITRVVEDDGRTKSFVALLNDLLNNFQDIIQSGKLDHKFTAKINESNYNNVPSEHFRAERTNNQITWEKINSDKFDLLKETAKLKIFRDKWIAHIDQKRKHLTIEYDEINRIVDFLNDKMWEYDVFLTGSGLASFHTSGLEEDEEIFSFAWLGKN